jgi:ATP-binding cassette subfamily B protein
VFKSINSKAVSIAANMVAIDRVVNVLSEETEELNTTTPVVTIEKGDISFSDVRFGYTDGIEILKGVNLHIASGERISLVGYSGAGKTTIADLQLLFYLMTVQ